MPTLPHYFPSTARSKVERSIFNSGAAGRFHSKVIHNSSRIFNQLSQNDQNNLKNGLVDEGILATSRTKRGALIYIHSEFCAVGSQVSNWSIVNNVKQVSKAFDTRTPYHIRVWGLLSKKQQRYVFFIFWRGFKKDIPPHDFLTISPKPLQHIAF